MTWRRPSSGHQGQVGGSGVSATVDDPPAAYNVTQPWVVVVGGCHSPWELASPLCLSSIPVCKLAYRHCLSRSKLQCCLGMSGNCTVKPAFTPPPLQPPLHIPFCKHTLTPSHLTHFVCPSPFRPIGPAACGSAARHCHAQPGGPKQLGQHPGGPPAV